jgi:hypothetical protein
VEWRTGVMCRKIRKKSLPSRKRITRDESILTRKKKGQSLSPFSLANNRQSRTEFFFEWKSLSLSTPHTKKWNKHNKIEKGGGEIDEDRSPIIYLPR